MLEGIGKSSSTDRIRTSVEGRVGGHVSPRISLVVPVFNEAAIISEFHRRATTVLRQCGHPYEIVFVDDGSSDNSLGMLRDLANGDPHIRIVSFSRNFGHQAAVTAGMRNAGGRAVIVIDGDLQDPPELIPNLIALWEQGNDVVYAVRRTRQEHWLMQLAYRAFYRLLRRLSYVDIPLDSGDFALMDRRIVDLLNQMPERNRFVRGIRAWVGFRQTGFEYDRDRRFAGDTKYSMRKLLQLAFDGLTSYSFAPLRLVTQLGLTISLVAFLSAAFFFVRRVLAGTYPQGWTSTIVVILFLGGVQLVALGVLGEYLGRIFDEVKSRPPYIIRETIGFETESGRPGEAQLREESDAG